jgi:nitroimidazol reductase NimA-like FMN-containing flavoprotein (pyridoxamine 5'-phosphate oxidase superfamily)
MTYAECVKLLSASEVGRAAVCTPAGPRIVPVTYSVLEDAIVFRATAYSVLGTYAWNTQLAFEVDHVDAIEHHGWSVLATGRGEVADHPDEVAAIRASWDPKPWANGDRLIYIRLRWSELNGRRLGTP